MNHLFVVGSPRSGTTWLQLLLAQHRAVATGKETQLFTQYVARLEERWAEELREAEKGVTNGLTRVFSEEDFRDAIRAFCDQVLCKLAEASPDADFVLEKSPEHSLHGQTIIELYPDAWFLHIVRDPRAVSNSFRHAAEKWWTWAPSGPIETTRRWRKNVNAGRAIADLTTRYNEVRYEDLISRGDETLMEIFAWLGLDADASFCQEALSACEIEKLTRAAGDQPWKTDREPEGFFRTGTADSWRNELSPRDIAIIEYEARDLMAQLDYTPASRRDVARPPLRVRFHDWLEGARAAARDLAHRIDRRVVKRLSRM